MDSTIRKLERLASSGDTEAQNKLVEWKYRLGELKVSPSSDNMRVIPQNEANIYLAVTRFSFLWEARVCSCCSSPLERFHIWSHQVEQHFCSMECYWEYRLVFEWCWEEE